MSRLCEANRHSLTNSPLRTSHLRKNRAHLKGPLFGSFCSQTAKDCNYKQDSLLSSKGIDIYVGEGSHSSKKLCSPGFSMMLVIVSCGFNLPTRSGLPRAGKAPDGYFTAKSGATHPVNYRREIIFAATQYFFVAVPCFLKSC